MKDSYRLLSPWRTMYCILTQYELVAIQNTLSRPTKRQVILVGSLFRLIYLNNLDYVIFKDHPSHLSFQIFFKKFLVEVRFHSEHFFFCPGIHFCSFSNFTIPQKHIFCRASKSNICSDQIFSALAAKQCDQIDKLLVQRLAIFNN